MDRFKKNQYKNTPAGYKEQAEPSCALQLISVISRD